MRLNLGHKFQALHQWPVMKMLALAMALDSFICHQCVPLSTSVTARGVPGFLGGLKGFYAPVSNG